MSGPGPFDILCRILGVLIARVPVQAENDAPTAWERVIEAADAHLVTSALYPALHQSDRWERLPDPVRQYLTGVWELNRKRNDRIVAQTMDAIRVLNRHGVEPLLLKGAANLLTGIYPDPAVRIMSDIGLLVPAGAFEPALAALRAHGYREDGPFEYFAAQVDFHQHAPLVKDSEPVHIEVHRHLSPAEFRSLLTAVEAWNASETITFEDARFRVLCPTHRVLHHIIHTQLADSCHKNSRLDLRRLLDFGWLRIACDGRVDWHDVRDCFRRARYAGALGAYIMFAKRYLEIPMPAFYRAGIRGHWAYRKFLVRHRHPGVLTLMNYLERLPRSPRRLLTPGWYAEKYRFLLAQHRAGQPALSELDRRNARNTSADLCAVNRLPADQ